MDEFGLDESDAVPVVHHKQNHLRKNVVLAGHFREQFENDLVFKRSIGNKVNRLNLDLIKEK